MAWAIVRLHRKLPRRLDEEEFTRAVRRTCRDRHLPMKTRARHNRYFLPAGDSESGHGPIGPGGGDFMTSDEVLAPSSEADQLRRQLLQAQRLSSVGALASSVAHEFNNVL